MMYLCTGLTGALSWPSSHSRGCSTVLPQDSELRKPFAGKPAHKGPHLTSLRRHKQNNNSTSKGHLCNLFLPWFRVFLYVMQLCLLPFFWSCCLFISVCVDMFCNRRPHNNAFLLGACSRVPCKGCTLFKSYQVYNHFPYLFYKMPLYCYNIPQCYMALKIPF